MSTFDEFLEENGLEHHGVLGMHWGVRRPVGSNGLVKASSGKGSSSTSSESKLQPHEAVDHERAVKALAKAQEKGHSSLSNEELKLITNRIKAEQDFNKLTTDQTSSLQKQVEQLRLEKEYRTLTSEKALATRSTGRKILDKALKMAADEALKMATEKLTGSKDASGVIKQLADTAKASTKSKPMPFQVNPNKVKFSREKSTQHNLPDLMGVNKRK